MGPRLRRHVVVDVPVRVCDVGGWTDTWFAVRGLVCSLAVGPGVTVTASVVAGDGAVTVAVPDLGGSFDVAEAPPEHRLLAEAVAEAGGALPGRDITITITSAVPPATSLGTSAAVCVGVIAALDALATGSVRAPGELASAAHRVETLRVGRQSGVQDQVAAAHGGANLIAVDYPATTVRPIVLEPAVLSALAERLLHVAYGGRHDSSAVHEQVIAELESEGAGAPGLERLRVLADDARVALAAGDLEGWGRVLIEATEAQRSLHPALVSPDADALLSAAGSVGALGWKVNGAGGAGGSLSVLCPTTTARDRLDAEARRLGQVPLALQLAPRGARVVGYS